MTSLQLRWNGQHWDGGELAPFNHANTLVLLFGDLPRFTDAIDALRETLPLARLVGCTTAGEISALGTSDGTLIATLIGFDSVRLHLVTAEVDDRKASYQAGQRLALALDSEGLRYIMVISEGVTVNGSELTKGLCDTHPTIPITGGLAGDGECFKETSVLANERLASHLVVAIGFYGERLRVGYGSRGGWTPFGPVRTVTAADGNVLKELDHESALTVYRRYLGELGCDLPAAGLRYPLEIQEANKPTTVVRTLLAIDEHSGSITFAGDIPQGANVRMMRANAESLIEGASQAASVCQQGEASQPEVIILISCVGRRLLLRQLADDEIDQVVEVLGKQAQVCGYYSYGEIAPFELGNCAELHNQTMTVTALSEAPPHASSS